MQDQSLHDSDSKPQKSGAGTTSIIGVEGSKKIASLSRSEFTRYDHSFVPGERVRGSFVRFDKMGETKQEFDELLLEHGSNGVIWLHFAVRPPTQQNRRKISFLKA